MSIQLPHRLPCQPSILPTVIARALLSCVLFAVCSVARVPGVVLTDTLPSGTCRQDNDCNSADLMCDITSTTGAVCICDAVSGSDTCNKYSSCVRTPCAVCSDCLSQMANFTLAQQYNQNSTDIAGAFRAYCTATKTWSAAQCAAAVQAVASNKPSYGKRAGNLCQALGVCGASGSAALGAGCVLKVLVPAAGVDRQAVQLSGTLDMCAAEGVASGKDVPGTTRMLSLPTGTHRVVPRRLRRGGVALNSLSFKYHAHAILFLSVVGGRCVHSEYPLASSNTSQPSKVRYHAAIHAATVFSLCRHLRLVR